MTQPPSRPKIALPPGACDAHIHMFGPLDLYPQFPESDGKPRPPTGVHFAEEWLKMQETLGLSRALLVQSVRHSHNYEQMLHLLSRLPDRLRGVAVPHGGITDRELDILTGAGVVGARFVYHQNAVLDRRLIDRVHERGWGAHYFFSGDKACDAWRDPILASPGQFVIDHLAHAPVAKGLDSPQFRLLLDALDTGRGWLKLSVNFSKDPHNRPQMTPPFADTIAIVRKLVEHAPNRILWGSDWPHTRYDPWPDTARFLDAMLDWVPDETTRNRIFVENAEEAFGFSPAKR